MDSDLKYACNFYRAFSAVYLMQIARFWNRPQGEIMVENFKSRILPEMNKAGCVSLTSLDNDDMEVSKMWGLLCRNNIIEQEFWLVIENIIKNSGKVNLIRLNNSPKEIKINSDLFLKEICSIFKVSIIIFNPDYEPYKTIKSNPSECFVGILLNVNEKNLFIPRFTNNEVNLPESTYLKEPYCFFSGEIKQTEKSGDDELLKLLADVIKEYKLHLSQAEKNELAEAIMLDERFIGLRNELLTTITCDHLGCLKIFSCKKLHCYKCLSDEISYGSQEGPVKCSCGLNYSEEDKSFARKLI